jgi:hypothetical protein
MYRQSGIIENLRSSSSSGRHLARKQVGRDMSSFSRADHGTRAADLIDLEPSHLNLPSWDSISHHRRGARWIGISAASREARSVPVILDCKIVLYHFPVH